MPVLRIRRCLLVLALAVALNAQAQSVGSAFSYQGELRAAGVPANAAFDFQFRLYNSPSGTTQLGTQVNANSVTVTNGLFSLPLDFGPAQFAGDAQWLEISVRPAGSGAFETLSPRTAVTATPYALGAVAALANSVTGTSIVDGSVQSGDLAPGGVGTAQVNATQVQRRVSGTCAAAQGVQSIGQDGTVVCGNFGAGTITGVTAGSGLSGGGTTGSVTVGIANGGVGSAQIDPAQVQARVAGSCLSGQFMLGVNANGTVACAPDATGWGLSGNAGTDPASNFIGTTDNQPLEMRVSNERVWRATVVQSDLFPGTNVTVGHRSNSADGNFSGQTIAGGGTTTAPNRTAAFFATIGGGANNTANGERSTIAGGVANQASGDTSTVGGGFRNCAGGAGSWAGGSNAKVRPGTNPGGSGACAGLTSYPGSALGDSGTFIWADRPGVAGFDFESTGPNQFLVRASGGVFFGADSAVAEIPAGRFISTSTGAHLTTGGSWTNASSRALKTAFESIDATDVLSRLVSLPITRWQYRDSPAEGVHLGPVAEEFHATFGLGTDGRAISTVDASGVALAAIQGLNAKLESERDGLQARVERLDAENAALRDETATLRDQTEALLERVAALESKAGGGR